MNKVCTICELNKPLEEYSFQRNQCKVCRCNYFKNHNKEVRKIGNSKREENLMSRMKAFKKYIHTEKGRNKKIIITKKQYQKHKINHLARSAVNYALKTGKLIKKDCEYINGRCFGRIEAHHWDYNFPLIIVWFCKKHHMLADNIRNLILK